MTISMGVIGDIRQIMARAGCRRAVQDPTPPAGLRRDTLQLKAAGGRETKKPRTTPTL